MKQKFISQFALHLTLILVVNGLCFSQTASPRQLYFGAAVSMDPFYNEPIYKQTLQNEFTMIVAENAFKGRRFTRRETHIISPTRTLWLILHRRII